MYSITINPQSLDMQEPSSTCLLLSSAAFLSDSACSALSKAVSLSSLSICIFFLMASMAAYCRGCPSKSKKKLDEKDQSVWTTLNAQLECELARVVVIKYIVWPGSNWIPNTFLETTAAVCQRDLSFFPWISSVIRSSGTFLWLYMAYRRSIRRRAHQDFSVHSYK